MQKEKAIAKPIEVKTLFGRHFVSPNDYVWVKFQESFARKKAAHLMPGDEILIRKDGISGLTLEQIGETLAKSQSYQKKARELFVEFSGNAIPLFQHALLSGAIECPGKWPALLAGDISFKAQFSAGKPFELSFEQLGEAAELIHRKLADSGMENPVSVYNIHYNWLSGNVVCPHNSNQVANALLEISPALSKLTEESFRQAYRGYLAARIGIMRAVSGMLKPSPMPSSNGIADGSPPKKQRTPSLSFKPEIAEVIRMFAGDITPNMLSSAIISIGSGQKQPVQNSAKGKDISTSAKQVLSDADKLALFKGIVTESIDGQKIQKRKLSDLAYEYNAMEGVAIGLVGNLLVENKEAIGFNVHPDAAGNLFVSVKFELSRFLGYREFQLQKIRDRLAEERLYNPKFVQLPIPGENRLAEIYAKLLGELILSGKLDAKHNLPRGSLRSFFEYESKLRTFLPTEILLCAALEEMVKHKKELGRKSQQAIGVANEERLFRKVFGKSQDFIEAYGQFRKRPNSYELRAMLKKAKLDGISGMHDKYLGFF